MSMYPIHAIRVEETKHRERELRRRAERARHSSSCRPAGSPPRTPDAR